MKRFSKYFIPMIYIAIVCLMVMCVLLVIGGIKAFLSDYPKYDFTLDDVFDSDVLPVVKTESNVIVKPYISDNVKIDKYFYDYKDSKERQEDSLIIYKNTYIQNHGVDYVSNEDFDVVSSIGGEVVSIEDNEIYGKILTIRVNEDMDIIYYNIKDILVSVGYKSSQGEIIAKSDVSKFDNKKNLLHFEVYHISWTNKVHERNFLLSFGIYFF